MRDISKEDFLDLRKKHKSDSEIAKELNCSRQYLNYLRKSFCIPSIRKNNITRDEKIFQESFTNKSKLRISRKYKVSVCHVYRVIKKWRDFGKKRIN